MKAIIQGRKYDTETAEHIVGYSNNLGCGDFRHYEEDLYRTKKGNWFLAGEGGPMTKYSHTVGDATSGGSGIIPLTNQEAFEWLEAKEFYKTLERYFGDKIEEA